MFLYMGHTTPFFQAMGKTPDSREQLKTCVSSGDMMSTHSFHTRLLILSSPVDFQTFSNASFFRTATESSNLKEKVCGMIGTLIAGAPKSLTEAVHCAANDEFRHLAFFPLAMSLGNC